MDSKIKFPARFSGIQYVPWEATLFFIGWIWLGWSVFGMTLFNISMSEPVIYIYHLIVGIVYLLPMCVAGYKFIKSKNIAVIPLIICSFVIGTLAILSHSKLNLGVYDSFFFLRGFEILLLILVLVAMPVSFYIFARSIGCPNNWNLNILIIVSSINFTVLVYNQLIGRYGFDSELIAGLILSFLFVTGPISGGVYIREVMSANDSFIEQ
jgi:hypothetical protein